MYKITCVCPEDGGECAWSTKKGFGNCVACQKASLRARNIPPSFKVLKDFAEDDVFEGASGLKMRTRMVTKSTETLESWTIAIAFNESQEWVFFHARN